MPTRLISLIALVCFSFSLHAQSDTRTRYQIYGGYTFLSNNFSGVPGSSHPLNGWDASAALPWWHSLRFKIDTFAYRGTNLGAQQHAIFFLGGGQYTWHLGRESVFVEGLAGEGGLNHNWGPNQTLSGTASFSSLAGGGLDKPLTRHVSLRASGDYQRANFFLIQSKAYPAGYRIPGMPNNFARISVGCVWNFQKKTGR